MSLLVLARAKAKGTLSPERQPKAKNRRLARIEASMGNLQARLKRDFRSSDPNRFLTALAVGLMVETSEDPVFSWRKRNVELEDKTAVFRSKGKRKPITNTAVVAALADAYEAIEDGDEELFKHDMGRVTADMISDYLGNFKLSMKDIRGYNASRLMPVKLAETRAGGPELPRNRRSRTKLLQAEFFKVLEATADEVGLEPDSVRLDYLPPGLEAAYLDSGNLAKTASTDRLSEAVAARFLKLHG